MQHAVVVQGRDVFNEKPAEEEIIDEAATAAAVLPAAATLHTTLGDIVIKLQGELCPRTVENFSTHAKNGYFDSILFHRIIKNFMIQTGALSSPSRNLLIISKRDSENSPECLNFLYLCGNHWRCPCHPCPSFRGFYRLREAIGCSAES